jgi:hypothetical protein
MAVPSGLTLEIEERTTANGDYVRFIGYGTFTAADFYITAKPKYAHYGETAWDPNLDVVGESDAVQLTFGGLGFAPRVVSVYNLIDGTGAKYWLNANLTTKNGYTLAAAGDKTPDLSSATNGVAYSGGTLFVDVSTCTITSNDAFVIECWR